MLICLRTDQAFRGPFSHDEPLLAGETRVSLSKEQFAALDAFRRANPSAQIIFDGQAFALSPAEIARRAAIAEFESLSSKLEAEDTITPPATRKLIKHLTNKIRRLETKITP